MTNGSSQGLFIVVAVVIFGIFVAISYTLFRDQLTPSLGSIFSDSTIMPTTFYLADTPYEKEYVAMLPAHPSATPGFEEYTRVVDIDLSKLGESYSEDTVFEVTFSLKTLKEGNVLVYSMTSKYAQFEMVFEENNYTTNSRVFSKIGGDYEKFVLKFKLVKASEQHNGHSYLSFYTGYGTGNKVTVKNIKIRKVNE